MKLSSRELSRLSSVKMSAVRFALIDLSGTLHVEDEPTPNAVQALARLRESNIKFKFVTNTTKESSTTLFKRLQNIGFKVDKSEIYSSLSAAVKLIDEGKFNPYYLVSEDARTDFPATDEGRELDAVVVGLAPEVFNYENLNTAFRILMDKKPLIAIHQGKYYKRGDGIAIGPGLFIKGLEYSASTKAVLVGKPNAKFYEGAIPDGITKEECVMIGDDINDDIKGAMSIGMKGILVKTGKYIPGLQIDPPPTVTLRNFSEAVDWMLKQNAEKVKQ